jgi:hypothetical protein
VEGEVAEVLNVISERSSATFYPNASREQKRSEKRRKSFEEMEKLLVVRVIYCGARLIEQHIQSSVTSNK